LVVLLCLASAWAASQGADPELRRVYEQAQAAHSAKDYAAFLTHSRRVAELAPRSTRALYNLACAHALTGGRAEAIRLLDRLAEMGARMRLAPGGRGIEEVTVVERGHPDFGEPTLGVVVGNAFYFVANSQYGAFAEDGTLDEAKLRPPLILRASLPWL